MSNLYDALNYRIFAPFERYKFFFLSGYVVTFLSALLSDWLASYHGFIGIAASDDLPGAARFMVDTYFVVCAIFIGIIFTGLSRENIRKANDGIDSYESMKHPVIGALLVPVIVCYLFFWRDPGASSFWFHPKNVLFMAIWIPLMEYVVAFSFIVLSCRLLRER